MQSYRSSQAGLKAVRRRYPVYPCKPDKKPETILSAVYESCAAPSPPSPRSGVCNGHTDTVHWTVDDPVDSRTGDRYIRSANALTPDIPDTVLQYRTSSEIPPSGILLFFAMILFLAFRYHGIYSIIFIVPYFGPFFG